MTDEVIVVYANSLFLSRPNKTPSQRKAYPPKKKVSEKRIGKKLFSSCINS